MKNNYINYLFILIFAYVPCLSADSPLQPEEVSQAAVPAAAPEQAGEETQQHAVPQAELRQAVERYSERVDLLEAEYGAWYPGLQEELIGLGQAWLNVGEYEDAINVFTRAMHINRINEGLYSLSQQDVLKHLIDVNTQVNDLDALTDNYTYLIWLYENNYSADDIRRVPAYHLAANGHLHAATFSTDSKRTIRHLVLATHLFSHAVETIAFAKGENDPALIDSLHGIVRANHKLVEPYGFLSSVPSHLETQFNSSRAVSISSLSPRFGIPGSVRRDLERSSVPVYRGSSVDKNMISLVVKSYQHAREALLRIIDIHEKNPHLPDAAYISALVDMGDWYLRFSRRSNAELYYGRASQLIAAGDFSDEQKQILFSRPRPLGVVQKEPEFEFERLRIVSTEQVQVSGQTVPQQEIDLTGTAPDAGKYVVAEFTVTKYGRVRDLKIIKSIPADSYRFKKMATSMIKLTPFRPRVVDHQMVQTKQVRMVYRFE